MQGDSECGVGPGSPAPALRPVADGEDGGAMPLRAIAPLSTPVTPMGRSCGCRICWLAGACGLLPIEEQWKSSFDVTVRSTGVSKKADLFAEAT